MNPGRSKLENSLNCGQILNILNIKNVIRTLKKNRNISVWFEVTWSFAELAVMDDETGFQGTILINESEGTLVTLIILTYTYCINAYFL
jgi:hypothetical protein